MKHEKTFEAINKLKEIEIELHRLKNALEMTNRALETKDKQSGSSAITNPEFVAEQKEKTQQLRNMVDVQNMASKSTYKEQIETKDEPVAWMNRHGACKTSLFMEVEAGAKEEYTIPLYTTPQQRKPLTRDEVEKLFWEWKDRSGYSIALFEFRNICNAIEAAHGIKE